ncbi:MAG: LPS assembly protein LptD [Planctomycetes bacterium]|nr:LPS assembly protein LptD [Planctomycetota bacterium]
MAPAVHREPVGAARGARRFLPPVAARALAVGGLVLAAWLMLAPPAGGQLDRLRGISGELADFEVRYRYGRLTLWQQGARLNKLAVTEGFALVARPRGGARMTLRSDSAVIWIDPNVKLPLPGLPPPRNFVPRPFYEGSPSPGQWLDLRAVQAIYAEGDVYLDLDGQVLRAERLFFDTVLQQVVLVDGFASGVLRQGPGRPAIPFHVRAEELRLELERPAEDRGPDPRPRARFRARGCAASSCDFGIPHYHIHASDIRIDPYEDDHVTVALSSATLNVLGLPVFYLPYLWGRSSLLEYFPLRSVSAGSSRRFGTFVYTEWGDDIRMRDADGRRRKWGSWRLHLDNRNRRGPAAGLDLDYRTENYHGAVTGYYTRDEGTDLAGGTAFDPPDNDRGYFRSFHRQRLPGDVQLDVETAWIRDRNFLHEYFEDEARTGKIQENYARLSRDWDNATFRLLVRPRGNDFFTQAEHLPQFTAALYSQPLVPGGFLATNLYLDAEAEATHARLRFDEASNWPDLNGDRAGMAAAFELPLRVGPLHLAPFFSGSYTGYRATRKPSEIPPVEVDEPDGRHTWTAGLRAHMQFWKVYRGALLGMDLRHLIEPQLLYTNTFDTSLEPAAIIPLDDTAPPAEFEAITVRLQNRLQVKPGRDVLDVLQFNLENVFYPEKDRDNMGHTAGSLFADLRAGVAPFLLLADGRYDWNEHDLLLGNVGILSALGPLPGIARSHAALYVGHRFARRISDVFTVNLRAGLGDKWSVATFFQYDYRGDRVLNQRYVLGRSFHRFRLEMEFYDDGGSGDHGFRIRFAPVEYFQRRPRNLDALADGRFLGDY